jgi:hypothetical protein
MTASANDPTTINPFGPAFTVTGTGPASATFNNNLTVYFTVKNTGSSPLLVRSRFTSLLHRATFRQSPFLVTRGTAMQALSLVLVAMCLRRVKAIPR